MVDLPIHDAGTAKRAIAVGGGPNNYHPTHLLSGLMARRLLVCLCLVWLLASALRAETRNEYDVKAAYLYHFSRYIRWQESSLSEGFPICVYGDNPFQKRLQSLVGKTVRGQPIRVQEVPRGSVPDECKVVFFSESEQGRFHTLLESSRKANMLSVSDAPDFVSQGGVIGLERSGNTVRFVINLQAARDAGLTVDSRLLNLAAEVVQ